jgi:carbamoyltransferase
VHGRRRGPQLRGQRPAVAGRPSFENVWIQPAAGDAGGALGAALTVWHHVKGNARQADGVKDSMQGAYLGPNFDDEVEDFLKARGYPARKLTGQEWATTVARIMAEENVVGLVQGRMEFGPARWAAAPSSAMRARPRCSR